MNYYRFKTDRMPDCEICGKPMDYWRIGQEHYAHSKCLAEKIANDMIKSIEKDLSKITIN